MIAPEAHLIVYFNLALNTIVKGKACFNKQARMKLSSQDISDYKTQLFKIIKDMNQSHII